MARKELNEVLQPVGDRDEWLRLPGLYRRFEFEQVIEVGRAFYIEDAGQDERGMALHRIYYRPRCLAPPDSTDPRGGAPAFAGRVA